MTGAASRCRGLVEDNAEILQSAAAAYVSGSRPLGLALTCEDAGAAFARHGQLGHPLLDQAIGIYEQLDAAHDLARPRRRCARRASGAVAGGSGPGRNSAGQSHPGRAHDRWSGR